MLYSPIGRNKLCAVAYESAYFDSVNVQFLGSRRRTSEKTTDYYYNNSLANGGSSDYNIEYDGAVESANEDIYGSIITHEIGDSEDDCLLNKIIVAAIPFVEDASTFATYDYALTGNDYPKLVTFLRNVAFSRVPSGHEKEIDMVALNMAPKVSRPGLNPWRGTLQTPTATHTFVPGTDDKRTYTKDSGDVANFHESFMLIAPLHSKFRRCRLKYVCKFTSILRAITIEYQQLARRFG